MESLPKNCLLQIFGHLPFKDRIRAGGVNRLFKKISNESIDQTRSLDLTNDLAKYSLRSHPFHQLLESCSPNLERLNASFPCCIDLLEILPEFSYPKLDHVELAVAHSLSDNEVNRIKSCFSKLIIRNRNIRSIKLRLAYEFEFPTDVIFDRLENLEIYAGIDNEEVMKAIYDHLNFICLASLLRSLTNRVPNLKRLMIHTFEDDGECPSDICLLSHLHPSINQFIGSLPNLQWLHLCSVSRGLEDGGVLNGYSNLWNLSSLIELRLDIFHITAFESHDQAILNKISTSFPRLQVFISHGVDYGGQILLALKNLKHLRKLHLPELLMEKSVFMEVLSSFPSLIFLEIESIDDVESGDLFIDVLQSIPARGKKVTLQFNSSDFRSFWDISSVKEYLEDLKTNGGPFIEIMGQNGA